MSTPTTADSLRERALELGLNLSTEDHDHAEVYELAASLMAENEALCEEGAAILNVMIERANKAEAALEASRAESARLKRAAELLADEIEGSEEHGGDATEDGCPICDAIAAVRAALSGAATPTPRGAPGGTCKCFGDSGLHASTHRDEFGVECCDLCSRTVPAGSTGVLPALDQHDGETPADCESGHGKVCHLTNCRMAGRCLGDEHDGETS